MVQIHPGPPAVPNLMKGGRSTVDVQIVTTTYFTNNVMVRHSVSLARAMALIDHAGAIVPPEAGIYEIHGVSESVLVPDQIIFNVNAALVPRLPQPTRRGVYERDGGICAYCGKILPLSAATLDHVVPQAQGGPDAWDNLVTACRRCNGRKGGRTPDQAHMKLLYRPFLPRVRLRPGDN